MENNMILIGVGSIYVFTQTLLRYNTVQPQLQSEIIPNKNSINFAIN